MKTTAFLIAATALTLAAPAHAQLLGGGGLTGGLNQVLNGSLDSRINTTIDRSLDHRTGRIGGKASADGALTGTLDSATGLTGPNGRQVSASKSARAEKRVSKSAAVEADGPGTDDGRALVGNVAGTARGVLGATVSTTQGAAAAARHQAAGTATGSASGNGSASGSPAASGGALAGSSSLTGSLAASGGGDGGLDVGTLVRDAKGRAVGRIQAVREQTQTVLVGVGDKVAALPANSLSVNGDVAASTMTKAEIRKLATTEPQPQS